MTMEVLSPTGTAAAILPASSFAESSNVEHGAAIGAPNRTKEIRMVRYERLDRSVPVIGVLRPAVRGTKTISTRLATLEEMIAQPYGRNADRRQGIAQNVSVRLIDHAERTSAPRQSRDAARALTTGWVALALEKPSQGRRSLSRIPASGPQGFLPVEFNLI